MFDEPSGAESKGGNRGFGGGTEIQQHLMRQAPNEPSRGISPTRGLVVTLLSNRIGVEFGVLSGLPLFRAIGQLVLRPRIGPIRGVMLTLLS
jgi:hypothetical protein